MVNIYWAEAIKYLTILNVSLIILIIRIQLVCIL